MAQEGRVGNRHEIMGPHATISIHTFRKDLDVLLHCCEYVTPLELERWNAGRLKPHAGRWAAGTVGSFDRGLGLDISDAARGTPRCRESDGASCGSIGLSVHPLLPEQYVHGGGIYQLILWAVEYRLLARSSQPLENS